MKNVLSTLKQKYSLGSLYNSDSIVTGAKFHENVGNKIKLIYGLPMRLAGASKDAIGSILENIICSSTRNNNHIIFGPDLSKVYVPQTIFDREYIKRK